MHVKRRLIALLTFIFTAFQSVGVYAFNSANVGNSNYSSISMGNATNKNLCSREAHGYLVYFTDEYLKYPITINQDHAYNMSELEYSFEFKYPKDYSDYYGFGAAGQYYLLDSDCSNAPGVWSYDTKVKQFYGGNLYDGDSQALTLISSGDAIGSGTSTFYIGKIKEKLLNLSTNGNLSSGVKNFWEHEWQKGSTSSLAEYGVGSDYGKQMWAAILVQGSGLEGYLNNSILFRDWYDSLSEDDRQKSENKAWVIAAYLYLMMNTYYSSWNSRADFALNKMIQSWCTNEYLSSDNRLTSTPICIVEKTVVYQTNGQNWIISASDAYDMLAGSDGYYSLENGVSASASWSTLAMMQSIANSTGGCRDGSINYQFNNSSRGMLGFRADGASISANGSTGSTYCYDLSINDTLKGFIATLCAEVASLEDTPKNDRQDIYIDPPLEKEVRRATVGEEVPVNLELRWKKDCSPEQLNADFAKSDDTVNSNFFRRWKTYISQNPSAKKSDKIFRMRVTVDRTNYGGAKLDSNDCEFGDYSSEHMFSYDDIRGFMCSEKVGTYMDTSAKDIPLNGEVTLKYESHVYITWPGGTEEEFTMDDGYAQITYKPLGENFVVYQSEPQSYSEVKNNQPKSEDFEAMAGTPTTRQLYVAFGGSEFVVDVQCQLKRVTSTRSFTDTYSTVDCDKLCWCPGHTDDEGKTYHCSGCEHHPCESNFSWSKSITYSYMEIEDVKIWRLDGGNISGLANTTGKEDSQVTDDGIEDDLNVFYHIAKSNSAAGGRLRYSYNGKGESNSDSVHWVQDSSDSHDHYFQDNEATDRGHRSEGMTVEVISDCVILQTSSGDQSVLYFEQPVYSTTCSEKSLVCPEYNIQQTWYNNSLSAGTWDKHEVNTIYYNGKFATPSVKFDSSGDGKHVSTVIDKGLEIDGSYILRPRNETTPRPASADSKELYKIFNPKVTHPNGEEDPGESELTYQLIVNENRGVSVDYDIDYLNGEYDPYDTDWTSAQVVDADLHVHAAYSDDHKKVNNIVFHNPVASQYAVINALPEERDQRLGSSKHQLVTSFNALNSYKKLKDGYRNNILYNGDFESKEDDGIGFAMGWEIEDLDKFITNTVHQTRVRDGNNHYLYFYNKYTEPVRITQTIPTDKYVRYKLRYNIRTSGEVTSYLDEYSNSTMCKEHRLDNYNSVNGTKEYDVDFTSINTTHLKVVFEVQPGAILQLDDVELYKTHKKEDEGWKEVFGFTPNYMTLTRAQEVSNPKYHNHLESGCGKIPVLGDGYDLVQAYAFLDKNGIKRYSVYEKGHPIDDDSYDEHDAIDLKTGKVYHNSTMVGGMIYGYFEANYYFDRVYTFESESHGTIYVRENDYYSGRHGNYVCVDADSGVIYDDCYNKSKYPVRNDLRFNLLSTAIWDSTGSYKWSCGFEDNSATVAPTMWDYKPAGVSIQNVPPADAYDNISESESMNGVGSSKASAGKFINLDYKFSITFENRGDFKGNDAYGIAETTADRGMGFKDDMDTLEWTACKYVIFPYDVIFVVDGKDKTYLAGEPIMLDVHKDTFEFYCTMNNPEFVSATAQFVAVANNNQKIPENFQTKINERDDFSSGSGEANEYENYKVDLMNWGLRNIPGSARDIVKSFDENNQSTNRERIGSNYKAKHSAYKEYSTAVVGRIGNNSIEDTGDFRYANIFKKSTTDWLIDKIVPKVDLSYQNMIIGDLKDIRGEKIDGDNDNYSSVFDFNRKSGYTKNFNTYGVNYQHDQHPIEYPLTPGLNQKYEGEGGIPALAKQPFRVGYPLYCDVQTIGSYADGVTSIYPYYFGLNLDEYVRSGDLMSCLAPTDIYVKVGSEYKLINSYEKLDENLLPKTSITNSNGEVVPIYDNKVYLDWEKEHIRRNCIMEPDEISDKNIGPTDKYAFGTRGEEWQRTVGQNKVKESVCYSWGTTEKLSYAKEQFYKREFIDNNVYDSLDDIQSLPMDYPRGKYFIQGNNNLLNLTGRCRTFMGTDYTYNQSTNPQDRINSIDFYKNGQRWHYTVTLPDTAVMVEAGKKCTPENIKKYKEKYKILVTGVSILAKGSVFTLVNDVDNNHIPSIVVNSDEGPKTINIDLKPFDEEGPPKDPSGGTPPPTQIINIMTPDKNSRDDLDSSGTH